MKTGYELFCEWCAEHNRNPPTEAWWDWACSLPKPKQDPLLTQMRVSTGIDKFQFEIDQERRDGWAYGETI